MKVNAIVFHGDAFWVEITKQGEFLFGIEDSNATATDILSRKETDALVLWLRNHLGE